nr:LSm family protein [Candidatus Sigynarchaeota archaeon]
MRPLDLLNLNLNRAVTIQIKRNQRYIGVLAGFDEHLNMYLENVKNEIILVPEETEDALDDDDVIEVLIKKSENAAEQPENVIVKPEVAKKEEAIGNIILRGDNVIFLKIDKPTFAARLPQKPGFQRPRFNPSSGQQRDQRRDQQGGRPQNRGYQKSYPPRRDQGGSRDDRRGDGRGGGSGGYPRRDNRDNRGPPRKPQGKPRED